MDTVMSDINKILRQYRLSIVSTQLVLWLIIMILMICCFECLAPQLAILLLTLSFSTYRGITLGSLLNYCLTYLISLSLLAFVNKKYEWVVLYKTWFWERECRHRHSTPAWCSMWRKINCCPPPTLSRISMKIKNRGPIIEEKILTQILTD